MIFLKPVSIWSNPQEYKEWHVPSIPNYAVRTHSSTPDNLFLKITIKAEHEEREIIAIMLFNNKQNLPEKFALVFKDFGKTIFVDSENYCTVIQTDCEALPYK